MLNRYSLLFKVITILTLAAILYVPVMGQAAYSSDYAQGRIDGELDGTGSALWFFGGFCLGGLGVILAFVLKPTPSTAHLMGMSPEYVAGYIDAYGSKAARQNGYYALGGLAALVVVYVIMVAIIIEDANDYWY